MDTLTSRAFAAYFRTGDEYQDQPSASGSGPVEHNGKGYVALRTGHKILAVYRIRNDGHLKRLRRWPAAVTNA